MTATVTETKGRDVPREPESPARASAPTTTVPFGSPDDLMKQPAPHADVVVGGKRYRVRGLWQGEAEEVAHASLKAGEGTDGKETIRADFRGRMARAIAYGWIHEDGRQVFANPLEDWKTVNQKLSPSVVRMLYKAIDELSAISEAEKESLGKGSGQTPADAG